MFSRIPLTFYIIGGLIGLLIFLFYLYHKEVENTGRLEEVNQSLTQRLSDLEENNRKLNESVALNAEKSLQDEQKRQELQATINSQKSQISKLKRLTKERNDEEQTPSNGDVYLSDSLNSVLKQAYCNNPTNRNSTSCKPSE